MSNQVVVEFLGNAKGLNTVIGRLDQKLGTLGKLVSRVGIAAGLAVTAVATESIRSFANFDEAMTNSQAIMGDLTNKQMADMQAAAIEVGKTTRVSATEAAESFFFLASAGMDASQSIEALPIVASFAQAGNFDMAQATDLLTDALSATGIESSNAAEELANLTHISDVFVAGNNLANTSVEQLSQAFTNGAGSTMDAFGFSLEDTTGILLAFADAGEKGPRAGSRFTSMMQNLSNAWGRNTDKFLEAGINFKNAEGDFIDGIEMLRQLEEATEGMGTEERAQFLGLEGLGLGTDALKGINLALGQGSEKMDEYATGLEDVGGVTAEVADKQLNSMAAQWDLVKGTMEGAVLTATGELKPQFIEVLTTLRGFVEQHGPGIMNGLMNGIGNIISFLIEKGPQIYATVSNVFTTSAAILDGIWEGIKAVWEAVGVPIVAAIQEALPGIMQTLTQWWEDEGQGIMDQLYATIQLVFGYLISWWERHGPAVVALIRNVMQTWVETGQKIKELWDDYLKDVFVGFGVVVAILAEVVGILIGVLAKYQVHSRVVGLIVDILIGTFKALVGVGRVIVTVLVEMVVQGVRFAGWISDTLIPHMVNGMAVIEKAFRDIGNFFVGLWEELQDDWEAIKAGWNAVDSAFRLGITRIKNAFTGWFDDVKAGFGRVKDSLTTAWDRIKGAFTDPFGSIGNLFAPIVLAFENAINAMIRQWNDFGFGLTLPGILGGGEFRIDTPNVSLVNIPGYATGAVVAPNNPHLAFLGDNTVEREIVTPESLMRSIVRSELDGSGGGRGAGVMVHVDTLNQTSTVEELADELMRYAQTGGSF